MFPRPVVLLGLCASFASAAEIRIQPGEKVIAGALALAQSGDLVVLAPGVYSETVRIEKTLTLRGEPGAILDGATRLKAAWSPAEGLERVFVTPMTKEPPGVLVDGKLIAALRLDRAQKGGDWHWRTLLARGTPLSGFAQIRALWMYHPGEKRLYVRLENGASPEQAALSVIRSGDPLLDIAAPGVVVEGVTLRGGRDAIRLGPGAQDGLVRRCTITSYEDTGILLTGGAARCTVEDCTITRGALEEWQPTNEKRRENYEIWRVHKDVGRYDRVGIDLVGAGAGNRILRNHLDRVFDGICLGDSRAESLDKPLPDPESGRGTEIAHNVIENTRDSGLELGTGCIDVDVHHNTLRRTHGGLRFKVPRLGPLFVHHNRLLDGTPFNIWFSMDASSAEGYLYHNTIEGGGDAALVYSSFNARRAFATPQWHVLNNLALGVKDGFFAQRKDTPPRDFTDAHNLVTTNPQAAIDTGLDLSTYRKGQPLPGCEKATIKGHAPDVGADEK